MAGQSRTIPGHGARHTTAAVVFCCLILTIFPAAALRADYLVTGPAGETISTRSYLIRGGMLYFAEDREPMNAYQVRSVREEDLSEDQIGQREEALRELRCQVGVLMERENAILKEQTGLLAEISEREARTDTGLESKERKSFQPGLESRRRGVRDLKVAWRELELPEYSLLLMRDIKMLQLMALEASVDHALKYTESGDPTNREYAWEHLRQTISFQESFREALPWK